MLYEVITKLVPPVARQRHRDPFARQLREEKGGHARDVAEGLVEEPHDIVEKAEVSRTNDPLVMIGPVAPRGDPRVAKLVDRITSYNVCYTKLLRPSPIRFWTWS